MELVIISFLTSVVASLLVIRYTRGHAMFSVELLDGPQRFHSESVPRIGGVSLILAALVAFSYTASTGSEDAILRWLFLAASLPAFLAGLVEDVARNVSPHRRLLMNAASAALGIWLLDGVLTRTAIPGVDLLIRWYPVAVALTVFAVTGVANAINIIDGFNGLASMCVLIMLLAIGYVAFNVGDIFILTTALILSGAVLGFFVWNFPAGLIFLGDGGAYFLGFTLAELGVLLIERNPSVSPLCPLLICVYPIVETVFSIYRRKFVRGVAAIAPDGIHLHTLLYRRVLRPATHVQQDRRQMVRNSLTSPYLWALCLASVIPSILWWDNTAVLSVFLLLFVVSYVFLYWRILNFKTPKWLLLQR
ncbi:MAG TPA: glycosyltransferase [Albitalea sp.]|uniref:MraY family glycosyltransferase n=1 Tax=Piscinibacter sp. TaxID=1903157 RepID=UPI002ECFD773